MSQEQQPIRSRRELRRARAERLEDQPQDRTLGQDQPLGQHEGSGQHEDSGQGVSSDPRVDSEPTPGTGTAPAAEAGMPVRPRQRRAAAPPSDEASAEAVAERSSQIRARDRAALRAIKELEDKEEQLAGGGRPTRRQLRLQQLKEEVAPSTSMIPVLNGKPRVTAGPGSSKGPAAAAKNSAAAKNPVPQAQNSAAGVQAAAGELSVEQALAARELIAAQAQNQLAKMEHIADQDPEAVDPDVLAEQIALAERAAVLNKRALAKQKLAEQNGRPTAAKTDPTAANNLAMVTPLEFVKVPGVDRPVMKPPTTSFVPVATPSPQQPATGKSSGWAGRSGRRGVLARAEAAARAATGNRRAARPDPVSTADPLPTAAFATVSASEQAEPPRVAARSAYGLEPLDAATAGLGRAQRSRLLQLGVLALGITALIAGIIMIISGLTR